jgi:mannose-6-phosphate isomerase-like protein (cupin superfamily)
MAWMATLEKLNVSQIATTLDEPFSMKDVALVGDIVVSIYICQGMLAWHRHLDVDELFWVHEGTILLESEWGEVRLRPGELAVVPKGVGHRSSAGLRASVLLLRCGVIPERKNGRRRLYAISGEAKLKRIGLHGAIEALVLPFQFRTLACIEDSIVQAAWGEGTWPVEIPATHDALFFVLSGTATVRTSENVLHLHAGELAVVPQGAVYQLSTAQDTALVRVARENSSPTLPPGSSKEGR